MRRQARWAATILMVATAGLITAGPLFAASPRLSLITPRGVQRDTESVLTFRGSRLDDAEEILFYHPGIEVTKIEPNGNNRVDVHVKVAPDCRLGEHVAQVRTRSGISDYRTFYVGALPIIDEEEPNNEFDNPQSIPLNVTVHGTVTSEDVDYFAVDAKKGQRITAEIEGMRLGGTMFDPYVAILDSNRFELTAVDDTTLVYQDAVASIVAPEDGRYIIEVRESAYGGNGNCRYRLHVGTFPRPTAVYPAGGKMGDKIEVQFLGEPTGEFTQEFQLPSEPDEEFGLFATNGADDEEGGIAPSPNPFRLFEHGNVLEEGPNDTLETATPAELPKAFNGIISEPGDVDHFRFEAKKGDVWEVECYARRIRSPLDSVMTLYNAEGRRLESNDDSRGPDSYFQFEVPEDGEYIIQVKDHLDRGGPEYVYRIEFTPVKPSLTLGIPRTTRYGQERQQIFVPRGNRFATLVSAERENFRGEIVLDPEDLPEGITMVADPMPANMNQMPVVFEADADAPIAGKLVDFTGRHADPDENIRGGFHNDAILIRSRPGQTIYWSREVDRLPVAVVEEVPFKLEIVQPQVPLVRNGSMQLKIVAHREEGFDDPIEVQFPFRPPGVTAGTSVTIKEGETEAAYPLNARDNARLAEWPIYVIGSADINGDAWVASQMATLEVAEPYVQFAIVRSAVEQGKEATIVCKVQHDQEFDGAAKVELLGLPNKVTADVLDLTNDMEELVFKVKTEEDSPIGKHKNIACQVVVTQNDEPIVHRVGSTELRINKPLPPPKDEPEESEKKVAEKEEKSEEEKEKPLTRLEQLRQAAQQQAEGGGSD